MSNGIKKSHLHTARFGKSEFRSSKLYNYDFKENERVFDLHYGWGIIKEASATYLSNKISVSFDSNPLVTLDFHKNRGVMYGNTGSRTLFPKWYFEEEIIPEFERTKKKDNEDDPVS